MNKQEMNKYLESIGGLENGFYKDRPPITNSDFFSISDGWLKLTKDLIDDLIKLGWNKEVCQVKEKFGGLRFYINEGSKEIFQRIQDAEKLSSKTCETCGESGELRTNIGWYTTLCDKHYGQKSNEHRNN